MSKKLIAIAAAAALALTGLVATPASATTITQIVVTHGGIKGSDAGVEDVLNISTLLSSQTSSDSAYTIASDNTDRKVYFGSSTDAVTRNAVRAVVTTGAASTLSISSTAGVKVAASLTDSAGAAIAHDGGAVSLSGTTATGALTYTFYAWTTSTTAGSVTVDSGSSKFVFYVKAKVGPAYNLVDVTYPASLYTGETDAKVTWKLTDQWGNPVTTGTGIQPTGFGADFAVATYSATTKLWSSVISGIDESNVAINVAMSATDLSANGFAKPVKSSFKMISAGDLAAQVTTLTAQVATLTASVTALTADYNKLANRFNSRVTLKKAPTKKVALK
jgi:hypothetical protein